MSEVTVVNMSFQRQVELGIIKCDACGRKGDRLVGLNNLERNVLCDECHMARHDIRPEATDEERITYFLKNKDQFS